MARDKNLEPTLLVTRKEAARLLAVSESHLKDLTREGVFPAVRLGASLRYQRRDIEETIRRLADGDDS